MSREEILIYEWAMKKCEFWTEIICILFFNFRSMCMPCGAQLGSRNPATTTVPVDTILQACKS